MEKEAAGTSSGTKGSAHGDSRALLASQKELALLLAEKQRRINETRFTRHRLWPKQKEAVDFKGRVSAIMGGNRVGKTLTAAYYATCHATGLYPDDWQGKKFNCPTDGWCVGVTGASTRDIIQTELLGDIVHALGTGMIPKHLIVSTRKSNGVNDAIDTVYVRHVSGGISSISFKSAEQGRGKFQGTARHWVWIDEEPLRDGYDIFSECRMRTMTVDGQVLVTYTPLEGMNELCRYLLEEEDGSVKVTTISWDDAPHLTPEVRAEMERTMLPHEIEARKYGRPMVKEGMVFPFAESQITCEPFVVPNTWPHICGLDIGFTAPTAAILMARDPKTDIWYVINEYARERTDREEHAKALNNWGQGIYIACDPSANRTESDGRKTMRVYRELGLNIHNADNSVEAGITDLYEGLSSGKVKIFKTCRGLLEEIRYYQFENGKIKKKKDHRTDAWRYCYRARAHARPLSYFKAALRNLTNQGVSRGYEYQPASAAGY